MDMPAQLCFDEVSSTNEDRVKLFHFNANLSALREENKRIFTSKANEPLAPASYKLPRLRTSVAE